MASWLQFCGQNIHWWLLGHPRLSPHRWRHGQPVIWRCNHCQMEITKRRNDGLSGAKNTQRRGLETLIRIFSHAVKRGDRHGQECSTNVRNVWCIWREKLDGTTSPRHKIHSSKCWYWRDRAAKFGEEQSDYDCCGN